MLLFSPFRNILKCLSPQVQGTMPKSLFERQADSALGTRRLVVLLVPLAFGDTIGTLDRFISVSQWNLWMLLLIRLVTCFHISMRCKSLSYMVLQCVVIEFLACSIGLGT